MHSTLQSTVSTLFLVLSLSSPSAAGDWPQYNGAHHNRTSPESLTSRDWSQAEPAAQWLIDTPAGFSSFILADSMAFTLVTRDGRETCIACDQNTGEELWSRQLGKAKYDGGGNAGASDNKGGDGPRSSPAYSEGRVYVLGAHLKLSCLSAKDGSEVWSVDLEEEHGAENIHWQNSAAPLIEGDLVLVAGGGEGQAFLAFDKNRGKLEWSTGTETITHATPIATTIHGTRQVIFFMRSGLVSLVPGTGEELWRIEYPFRTSTAASPVVYEDVVYCSAGYGVGAGAFRVSKTETGWSSEPLWRKRNKLMNHWSTPLCKDGYLYGMFSFKDYGDGPMKCVDIRTGEELWSKDGFGPGNCILVGDDLVALTDAGEVVLVESTPEAYREISRAPYLEGKCWSTPTFADGDLFIRSTSQGMRINLSAGE